jgi:hypothetical protein
MRFHTDATASPRPIMIKKAKKTVSPRLEAEAVPRAEAIAVTPRHQLFLAITLVYTAVA